MRSLLTLEKRERSLNFEEPRHRISHGRTPSVHVLPFSGVLYCLLFCSILILFYFILFSSTSIRFEVVRKSTLIAATPAVCYCLIGLHCLPSLQRYNIFCVLG